MRFCCLGSGSEGNALVIESGSTRVLADCGFPVAETVLRLGRYGIEPESLSGIVVTHEHADHIGGVARFAARFGTPVWLTYGTLSAANGTQLPAGLTVTAADCEAAPAPAVFEPITLYENVPVFGKVRTDEATLPIAGPVVVHA